jgi:hypothetical protein
VSGSSFDYLYLKDAHEAVGNWAFERARTELRAYDHPGAQRAADKLDEMAKIRDDLAQMWQELSGILHDLEWWRSSDYGEDQFVEACEEFDREHSGAS